MSPIVAFFIGLLIGWIVEWIIDWLYWRRRQAALQAELDQAKADLAATGSGNVSLEGRLAAMADTDSLQERCSKLETEKVTLNQQLAALKAEKSSLMAQLQSCEGKLSAAVALPAVGGAAGAGAEFSGVSLTKKPVVPEVSDEFAVPTLKNPPTSADWLAKKPDLSADLNAPAVSADLSAPAVSADLHAPAVSADLNAPAVSADLNAPAVPTLPVEPAFTTPETVRLTKPGSFERDDLEIIKGIGPVINRKLNQAGIYTFEELGKITPARLREIVGDVIQRLADEQALIDQAKELAAKKARGG